MVKSTLLWFILGTWGYLLNLRLSSRILKNECINYNEDKLKKLSLLYSLVNIILIYSLFKNKAYLGIDEVAIDIINIYMLSIAASLDLMIMEVETDFLRFVLLVSILSTRRVNIVTSSLNALITYMQLYIVYQLSGGSIGGADVRILTILSFGYGWIWAILILTSAAWICLLWTLLSCFIKKRKRYKEIAFVPYIYLAYIFLIYRI